MFIVYLFHYETENNPNDSLFINLHTNCGILTLILLNKEILLTRKEKSLFYMLQHGQNSETC